MQIHTQNVIILPPTASADALSSMERFMQTIGRAEAPAVAAQPGGKPQIGDYWPEQGGIYIGSRLIDGQVHHVIIPGGIEFDHADIPFSRVEQVVAEGDELNGFSDWRAPDKEDLMLAYINSREHFDTDDWYWSRSEHHGWAWAVDFELGRTLNDFRYNEFRVRPVRSFPASAI